MVRNKKSKFLKCAVTTATATIVGTVLPSGSVLATTVITEGQVEDEQNVNAEGSVNLDSVSDDSTSKGSVLKLKSNKQEVPCFYYWTDQNAVYLSWDYGHIANRPSKIEVVIDNNPEFTNPSYVHVKPKGAEFIPNMDGDFYLRVRFLDSSGGVSHESVRKVIRNSSETREIKGLSYTPSGTGIKVEWANFVDGIKSGQVFLNGELYKILSEDDIKSNSVTIPNATEGSEIKIRILNGKGLEYNGVVMVKEGSLTPVAPIELGLSSDGVGIGVDLSKTNFTKGNMFLVKVRDTEDGEVIVENSQITLEQDKGSFVIYPDSGKTFLNGNYEVVITDMKNGGVYTYKYSHNLSQFPTFTSIPFSNGDVISSWSRLDGVAATDLTWYADGTSDYKSEKVSVDSNGITFKTGLPSGQKINLILTNYDNQGRIISQNFDSIIVGSQDVKTLDSFKAVFKGDSSSEFSWKKIGVNVVGGILVLNGRMIALSPAEVRNANSIDSFVVSGLDKKQSYSVDLYLLDDQGTVYRGTSPSILSGDVSEEFSDVIIEGGTGILGRYAVNPGILTLVLDENLYDVAPGSKISLTVAGKTISSLSAEYIADSHSINIRGLIPTKNYSDFVITYKDSSGESKSINLKSLLIKVGSVLDSFLIGAYNKSISRATNLIDEDGYNYWKNGLISKEINLSYFIRNLAFVPEFMSLIKSPEDLITRLYNVLVLRNPEPQGMKFWTSVYNELIKSGVSHNETVLRILTDMTSSPEFSNLAERLRVNP